MSAKKFEKLIDLIINEDQERANQLFHEIVVEKSREIYESIIDEDSIEGLMDEVDADEEGIAEGMDDDMDMGDDDMDMGDDDMDMGDDDFGDEEGESEFGDEEDGEFGDEEGDLEDRVVDLEDKLDELMAEFEAQMGGDEDMGDDDMEDMDDEDMGDDDMEDMDDEDEVMESVQLKKVQVTKGGDNGAQTRSPGLQNPRRIDNGGAPVKFAGDSETVPTSAKKPSNPYAKGEQTEDFGNVNVPGGNAGKTGFKTKAPAPKAESVKAKSPVAETKRTTKRRI
jgi:hypothetical protein